jgi:hypothetical protein
VATLLIDIEARFAKFQDSLDTISRDVARQVRGMERAFSAIGVSIASLGAALGAGAIATGVGNIVKGLADLDDAAEQSGASVESLSSLLNTLAPTGVGLEQITDLAGKLTRAMADADQESSKAAQAFKALGISTRDAAGNLRPVDDVLTELAESLAQYEDGSNKTALAQAILTKSGAQYLPLLKDLATRQRESATVTSDQAAAAESLANSWRTLGTESTKLAQQLAGPLVKALSDIIERFNAAGTAGENFYNRLRLAFQPDKEIARLEGVVRDLQAEYDALKGQDLSPVYDAGKIDRLAKLTERLAQARRELGDASIVRAIQQRNDPSLRAAEDRGFTPGRGQAPSSAESETVRKAQISDAERLTRALEEQVFTSLKLSEVEKLRSDIARGRVVFDSAAQRDRALAAAAQVDSIRAITQAADDESRAAIERIRRYEELERTQGAANEAAEASIQAQIDAWEDLADPTRQYQRELERINELLEQNRITSEQADRFRTSVVERMIGTLDDTKNEASETQNIARDLGLTFSSAFEDAILKGEKFSKVLQGIAQDIARIFLRKTVTEPLANFFANAASGLLAGVSAAGGATAATSAASNGSWDILPAAAGTGVATKSGGVTIYNQFASGVTQQDVANAAAMAAAQAKQEILSSMQRRGAYAGA